jgi:hypothetical protein
MCGGKTLSEMGRMSANLCTSATGTRIETHLKTMRALAFAGPCALAGLMWLGPRLELCSTAGICAARRGVVTAVGPTEIVVGERRYPVQARVADGGLVRWQEPVVRVGDPVQRKQLLARARIDLRPSRAGAAMLVALGLAASSILRRREPPGIAAETRARSACGR